MVIVNKKALGFLGLFTLAATVSLCGHYIGWQILAMMFNRETLVQFFSDARSSPVRSVGMFVAAHVVANAIGIPGTLLVVVGGAVYGLWWGTVWSVIGATWGAIAAFWLSRYLLHDWFKRRFAHRPVLQKLNRALQANSLRCVLIIRFSPISPFNVVNFALGLTPVLAKHYAIGTLVGIVPGTLAYTWLGVTGAEALNSGSFWPLICCLTLLMLLSALPLVMQRYQSPR